MSAPGLTSEAQLRYILQWFAEFSELQREDFLPILAAAKSGYYDQLATALATLSCQDKPVSLFQCRLKLFNEWYPTWSEDERSRLENGVSDADPEFGKKLQEELVNGTKVNGDINGTDDNTENQNRVHDSSGSNEEEEEGVTDNIPVEIVAAS